MAKVCVTLPKVMSPERVVISHTVLSEMLTMLWSAARDDGVLRYEVQDSKTRVVEGKHRFSADWNVHRFHKKRPAHVIASCDQPFDEDLFNFNKIRDKEV